MQPLVKSLVHRTPITSTRVHHHNLPRGNNSLNHNNKNTIQTTHTPYNSKYNSPPTPQRRQLINESNPKIKPTINPNLLRRSRKVRRHTPSKYHSNTRHLSSQLINKHPTVSQPTITAHSLSNVIPISTTNTPHRLITLNITLLSLKTRHTIPNPRIVTRPKRRRQRQPRTQRLTPRHLRQSLRVHTPRQHITISSPYLTRTRVLQRLHNHRHMLTHTQSRHRHPSLPQRTHATYHHAHRLGTRLQRTITPTLRDRLLRRSVNSTTVN